MCNRNRYINSEKTHSCKRFGQSLHQYHQYQYQNQYIYTRKFDHISHDHSNSQISQSDWCSRKHRFWAQIGPGFSEKSHESLLTEAPS